MPKLGSAYIDVRADKRNLKKDFDSAERDAKSGVTKIQSAIGKVSFAALTASAVAFGAAVTSAIASGVKSFADLERKMLRTESIIKATGNAAGLSSREILRLAEDIDLATLNDRDNILDAINAMQTFKSVSGDTFERSIRLAVDLAEVMGTDLRSQVVQLGKALEDPVTGLTALRRVGVSFSEAEKKLIKDLVEANRHLEAQGIILDAISTQVGGAAEGAAGGLSGSVDTLSFRWREFTEALTASAGAMGIVRGAIDGISGALADMSKFMKGMNAIELREDTIARLESLLRLYEMTGGRTKIDPAAVREQLDALRGAEDTYSLDYGSTAPVVAGGGGSNSGGGGSSTTFRHLAGSAGNYSGAVSIGGVLDPSQLSRAWTDPIGEVEEQTTSVARIVIDQFDAMQMGATDSFMGMAAANARASEMMEDQATSSSDVMKDAWTGWAVSFSQDLAGMLFDSDTTFSDIAKRWGEMLVQMALQAGTTDLMGSLFGSGGGSGSGGALSSLFSWLGSFAGGKADGGWIYPGQTAVVGERGPELLTMGGSGGYVTPNHQLGGSINISQKNDFRGADPVAIPQIKAMLARNRTETVNAIRQSMRRGGEFHRISR